ncbi:DUF292-domain-containing protein [Metschnikowia bicuspidata]|uniref:DUF292-domain-containing protein n=1 Tax=Metschnikowia bicuspidata TaxID=27322 RepID=A0A4P9ZBS3_9ASCO|nr:DUF292-domain-containing protein [Metschnikowia bicuspidata]
MTPAASLHSMRMNTTLKMAISKLKFLQEKKSALAKQQRRLLADLLSAGKEQSAKIRIENVIREDIEIELMELCELFCELLLARVLLVLDPHSKECDGSLREAVLLIIYCCGHMEIKELSTLGDLLKARYGPDFARRVAENVDYEYVPEKIVKRCNIMPPSETLVNLSLVEIARTYEVPYSGLPVEDVPAGDSGGEDSDTGGTREREAPLAISNARAQSSRLPLQPKKAQDDFDALKARFAALKR